MDQKLKQRKTGLKIISVIMALLLWAYVVNQGGERAGQNPIQVALDYRNVPAGFTVKGPEQVAVRLWGVVQKNAAVGAYVDLANYEAGAHEVPVQLEPGSGAVLTSIQPRRVQVVLIGVQERVFTISPEILRGPPEGYELLDISVNPDKCVVKGEEGSIGKVEQVIGQVDLSQAAEVTAYTVDLLPRDAGGRPVGGGIELLPRQATLHAVVAPRQSSREVPVTVITAGQAFSGLQVTNVSAQPEVVKVMGNSSLVADIGDVKTELVDLTDRKASFQTEAALQSTNGIKVFPARVTVNVTIGPVGAGGGE